MIVGGMAGSISGPWCHVMRQAGAGRNINEHYNPLLLGIMMRELDRALASGDEFTGYRIFIGEPPDEFIDHGYTLLVDNRVWITRYCGPQVIEILVPAQVRRGFSVEGCKGVYTLPRNTRFVRDGLKFVAHDTPDAVIPKLLS